MSQPTVSIVGAGIGGLTLGRCLLHRGIRAVLYEKAPSSPRHTYAITLQPASYRPLLKALDIDESTFRKRVAVDAGIGGSGNINAEGYGYRNLEPASFRAHRGKLEELLREGLDVRWEHTLQSVKTDGSLDLEFANGQCVKADIAIGIEGPHSVVRKQFLPSASPDILPYVAFNGKRRIPRETFDKLYASSYKNTTVLELRNGDIVLNISISEATPEQVSISWIYSRPSRGSSDALFKPNRPNAAAKDIPQEFYTEVEGLEELSQPFADVFDAEKLRKERVLHWLMRSILIQKSELQDLGLKKIALMGDAAHAEQIIGGGGANGAIDDGVSLAKWIAEKGTADITSWYHERYASWQKGQEESQASIAGIHGQQDAGKQKL
ncbi:FAD/NAD(P)-binding domain-containing protein [Didymella exigua CBS 183.55]|uniref:FAD/NAD(P)-binding domain-containing protein n=1 Tax=Didymella exigua CBS 183.55 TaxID=1150837 RepID=A0A6A5R3N2_9PLEO|nr:FAD/NAD(P)-binding domain-containing protein [Didymella exigua CBS 183.55]KAF1922675.1 FAD/NAD(P)-binding domain-containing protein [Didymella exigua CBS 183.55]